MFAKRDLLAVIWRHNHLKAKGASQCMKSLRTLSKEYIPMKIGIDITLPVLQAIYQEHASQSQEHLEQMFIADYRSNAGPLADHNTKQALERLYKRVIASRTDLDTNPIADLERASTAVFHELTAGWEWDTSKSYEL